VRLFPLPNLALYPHVMQPLHIYEDRYRELLEDALEDDGLIAMAMLEPGWEPDYEGTPPVASCACLGKIVAHHRLEDGHSNVLLLGMKRIRLLHELEPFRLFRQAEVELLEDCYSDDPALDPERLRYQLLTTFRQHLPAGCQSPEQIEELLTDYVSLGPLTDLVAYSLQMEMPVKQQLLAECQVEVRAQILLEQMQHLQRGSAASHIAGRFPPPFSLN